MGILISSDIEQNLFKRHDEPTSPELHVEVNIRSFSVNMRMSSFSVNMK